MFVVYGTTLTQVHTYDALCYAGDVDSQPWLNLFHPHHLAYGPMGALVKRVAAWLGYAGRAALPMQLANAFAGALGVVMCYLIGLHITRRPVPSAATAVLLGASYAYWYYAVEVEVYTVAVCLLLVSTWLLLQHLASPDPKLMALIGVAQGLAILFHQTNVLWCVPLVVAILTPQPSGASVAHRLRGWWCYGIALGMLAVVPYLVVGCVAKGLRNPHDLADWILLYARTGWWGGEITAGKWAQLGAGLSGAILPGRGGLLCWGLLLGVPLVFLRPLWRASPAITAASYSWLLVYGGFFLWWEPGNIEFWIASLPPLLLLALSAMDRLPLLGGVASFAACWLLLQNGMAIVARGDPANDFYRKQVKALVKVTDPSDLMLIPNGMLEMYLTYYEQRTNHLSIHRCMAETGGDWQHAQQNMKQRIDSALETGSAVVISDEVLSPPSALLALHHLDATDIAGLFNSIVAVAEPLPLSPELPHYWQIPQAQSLVSQSGWRFSTMSLGWRASFARQALLDAGWLLTSDQNLQMISPPFATPMEGLAIEITLWSDRNGTGNVFHAAPGNPFTTENVLPWSISTGEQVYVLPTTGFPPILGRLRLDPLVGAQDFQVKLLAVRLIRPRDSGAL
jgi:hypothetical protein